MNNLGRFLARAYVAVALFPLFMLAVGVGISLVGGKSVWPFFPYGMRDIDESQPVKDEITFRSGPVLVAGNAQDGTARYVMGVGKASSPTKPQDVVSPRGAVDAFYVVSAEVDYAGGTGVQVGEFNNILVQRKAGTASTKLFDRRVSVKSFAGVDTPNGAALVLLATDKDTNRDGKLNSKDIHGLYLHLFDGAPPREIAGLSGNVTAVDMLSETGALIVRTVLDTNGDGSAAKGYAVPYSPFPEEPQRVYRIDLKTLVATPMVAPTMIDELQKDLDAAAPPK